jgi:hypothetical protein
MKVIRNPIAGGFAMGIPTSRSLIRALSALALSGSLFIPSVATFAEESDGERSQRLVGTWAVDVSIRDCASDVAIFELFRVMNSFNRGGTLVETHSGATAGGPPGSGPADRSIGLGTWSFLGARRYEAVFTFFRYGADGSPAGTQTVARVITLSKAGNEFTAKATFQVRDPAGNVLFAACAREEARRLN